MGSVGDAAVWALQEGEFIFVDAAGNQVQTGQRLTHMFTIKNGQRWWQAPV